ncbi:MAG: hypothetical protein M4D80_39950 [Myxococcota bacterium]|nr:hypothetical protein [Deltaproteobacteria bacterium]MDQ3341369.1 hypothetical protein [Myxococcota bacterium]
MLVLGGTAAWAAQRFFRPKTKPGGTGRDSFEAADFAPDPRDPVQTFEDMASIQVDDLDLDAVDIADAEAAQDMAMLESELDESMDLDTSTMPTIDAATVSMDETGELYGVHTPRSVDNVLPDDLIAMDEGQNWIEALETSAAEYGAEPERELDILDEQDLAPHPSDTRDTPVADRGSGGPAGV